MNMINNLVTAIKTKHSMFEQTKGSILDDMEQVVETVSGLLDVCICIYSSYLFIFNFSLIIYLGG